MTSKRILSPALARALSSIFIVSSFAGTVFANRLPNGNDYALAASTIVSRAEAGKPRRRERTYDVAHYIIRTRFDVPNKTVFGEVDLTLSPLSNGLSTFELDAANMTIEEVSLASGGLLRATSDDDILRIALDRAYDSSESITVRIRYRTRPSRGLHFVSSSSQDGYSRPAQIWTQGQPEYNHYWFPCYDFPDDKATSEQYITTGGNQLAIANGTLAGAVSNANGTRTFHWQMDQPHSTYLISLVVGDYTKLADSYGRVAIEYYTYRGTESLARKAFSPTPAMMRWFSDVLDFEFPYPRYAQTVIGNFNFGGMENITSTTLADTEILDEDDKSFETLNLVSHELAHSWFGNLVTCKDWSHFWLNEGFATFMEAAYLEGREGRDAYLKELKKDAKEYFREDPSGKRHPLVNPNYPLSMDLFDATTYKKGAFVVHMLREVVGDEVFWTALNTYLNEFKYRAVDSRDLQRVFEKASGQSLEWFFDQWVYKAGYPELEVGSRYSSTKRRLTVNISQTQIPNKLSPVVFRLPVDVEIVTASGTRTERINVIRRTEDFSFEMSERPTSVIFDPRMSILKKMNVSQTRMVASFPILDGADVIEKRAVEAGLARRSMIFPESSYQHTALFRRGKLLYWPTKTRSTVELSR